MRSIPVFGIRAADNETYARNLNKKVLLSTKRMTFTRSVVTRRTKQYAQGQKVIATCETFLCSVPLRWISAVHGPVAATGGSTIVEAYE
jgi:hypothetical protein